MGCEAKLASKTILWSAQPGRAATPGRRPVSLDPRGRYPKKKQEQCVKRKNACSLQSQDNGRCRWTVGAGTLKEREEKRVKRNRPVGYKAGTGFDDGGAFGQIQPNRKKGGGEQNRQIGWGASTGPLTRDLRGLYT